MPKSRRPQPESKFRTGRAGGISGAIVMLEIGIVSNGVLYYFEQVSWINIEHRDKVRMIAEDGSILIMEDKDNANDDE